MNDFYSVKCTYQVLTSTLEHLSSVQFLVIIFGHWSLWLWLYLQAEFLKIDLLAERVWIFFQFLNTDCQSLSRNPVPIYSPTSCIRERPCAMTQGCVVSLQDARILATCSPALDQKPIKRTSWEPAGINYTSLLIFRNIFSGFRQKVSRVGTDS